MQRVHQRRELVLARQFPDELYDYPMAILRHTTGQQVGYDRCVVAAGSQL